MKIDISKIETYVREYLGNKDLVEVSELINAFDDLYVDYKNLEEEFENYKQDIEDNYKRMTIQEQIGE